VQQVKKHSPKSTFASQVVQPTRAGLPYASFTNRHDDLLAATATGDVQSLVHVEQHELARGQRNRSPRLRELADPGLLEHQRPISDINRMLRTKRPAIPVCTGGHATEAKITEIPELQLSAKATLVERFNDACLVQQNGWRQAPSVLADALCPPPQAIGGGKLLGRHTGQMIHREPSFFLFGTQSAEGVGG
jgi:hypothetical protein